MCLSAIYWARLDRIWFGNDRAAAASIGFDDSFLYDEVPRPLHARTIPTAPLRAEEARAAFDAWATKEDRVAY